MAEKPSVQETVPFLFESKYPGLQMHGREQKDGDGVRTLAKLIQFKPVPLGPKQPRDEGRGLFSTTDPQEAEWLRAQKSFKKGIVRELPRG